MNNNMFINMIDLLFYVKRIFDLLNKGTLSNINEDDIKDNITGCPKSNEAKFFFRFFFL